MALWSDELEELRPQLREEREAMIAAWPVDGADPSAPVEERVAAMRAARMMDAATSDRAVDRTIDGPAGPLRLRTIMPERQVDGVYLHFHGGGFMIGEPDMMDLLLVILVDALNVASVSVDYRLAPEDPYPAGSDDCEAAAVWLVENAQSEFGSDRLLVGGESAGGYYSAVTLLRMRDKHDAADRFLGANLVFGAYDLSRPPSQRGVGLPEGSDILTPESVNFFMSHFTPGMTDDDRRDPDISPLYAELHGMPPALFTVGTHDHLFDDTILMAARWQLAGNDAELIVYPEVPHGCMMMPTIASDWFPKLIDFLGRSLKG
jgi:acetyl esterase/lipase